MTIYMKSLVKIVLHLIKYIAFFSCILKVESAERGGGLYSDLEPSKIPNERLSLKTKKYNDNRYSPYDLHSTSTLRPVLNDEPCCSYFYQEKLLEEDEIENIYNDEDTTDDNLIQEHDEMFINDLGTVSFLSLLEDLPDPNSLMMDQDEEFSKSTGSLDGNLLCSDVSFEINENVNESDNNDLHESVNRNSPLTKEHTAAQLNFSSLTKKPHQQCLNNLDMNKMIVYIKFIAVKLFEFERTCCGIYLTNPLEEKNFNDNRTSTEVSSSSCSSSTLTTLSSSIFNNIPGSFFTVIVQHLHTIHKYIKTIKTNEISEIHKTVNKMKGQIFLLDFVNFTLSIYGKCKLMKPIEKLANSLQQDSTFFKEEESINDPEEILDTKILMKVYLHLLGNISWKYVLPQKRQFKDICIERKKAFMNLPKKGEDLDNNLNKLKSMFQTLLTFPPTQQSLYKARGYIKRLLHIYDEEDSSIEQLFNNPIIELQETISSLIKEFKGFHTRLANMKKINIKNLIFTHRQDEAVGVISNMRSLLNSVIHKQNQLKENLKMNLKESKIMGFYIFNQISSSLLFLSLITLKRKYETEKCFELYKEYVESSEMMLSKILPSYNFNDLNSFEQNIIYENDDKIINITLYMYLQIIRLFLFNINETYKEYFHFLFRCDPVLYREIQKDQFNIIKNFYKDCMEELKELSGILKEIDDFRCLIQLYIKSYKIMEEIHEKVHSTIIHMDQLNPETCTEDDFNNIKKEYNNTMDLYNKLFHYIDRM